MKPCLIIGSGFHRWVLGRDSSALSNWNMLIESVADKLKVSIPSTSLNPVLRWEKLLETAAVDGYEYKSNWIAPQSRKISLIESDAKNTVALVIKEFEFNYPDKNQRAQFIFQKNLGSVISLNFDNLWIKTNYQLSNIPPLKLDQLADRESRRIHNHITSDKSNNLKVWFPNGTVQDPDTIRMGLYDYGAQPSALKAIFGHIKEYENEIERLIGENNWEEYEKILTPQLEDNKNIDPRINNWVAHFLYRPLYFVGVGLSESEIGLWWLLAQRARNFAKLSKEKKPKTVILVKNDSQRNLFWSNRPCGVETIKCENWDIGWELIEDAITPKVINGGTF
jgi:hypothetical protein